MAAYGYTQETEHESDGEVYRVSLDEMSERERETEEQEREDRPAEFE